MAKKLSERFHLTNSAEDSIFDSEQDDSNLIEISTEEFDLEEDVCEIDRNSDAEDETTSVLIPPIMDELIVMQEPDDEEVEDPFAMRCVGSWFAPLTC